MVTPRPVKKVKADVAGKTKLEDIQIMALDKPIVVLDNKKEQKRNGEAALDVQMRLVRDTVRSKVREIKSDIMKEVGDKFEQIINLIKKK